MLAVLGGSPTALNLLGSMSNTQFSSDGKYLLIANGNRNPSLWNLEKGELLTKFDAGARVYYARFSPDSKMVATSDFHGYTKVWDTVTGEAIADKPTQTESFAMPDPNLFTARALRQVLADAGIAITGTTRSTTDSMRYRQARTTAPLAEISSRPFREWVFPILNRSQNWFAEMVSSSSAGSSGARARGTRGWRWSAGS